MRRAKTVSLLWVLGLGLGVGSGVGACSGKSNSTPDAGTSVPDAGTPDAGTPDAGPCTPGGDGGYLNGPYDTLSAYCMVDIENDQITLKPGVQPYDLNTPLFSDGAVKVRTIWMPPGTSATYDDTNPFTYPVGTLITKSFGFRDDLRKTQPVVTWVETRVLMNTANGWQGYTYLWDSAQQVATINYAGEVKNISWIAEDGSPTSTNYLVPSTNQCKQCHAQEGTMEILGPKARNLNRTLTYPDGSVENQLTHWTSIGYLTGAPADPSQAPKLPVWNDPSTGTTEQRARAYLEVNCAHCHNEQGSARTTGLYLWASNPDTSVVGVCKAPVAAGPGTGGFSYDVVPGDPDHSIMIFRISSVDPSLMMPLIGRSVVDTDGVQLIHDWIQGLTGTCP
jgi:uncharacterized repeat protein (TIGR03806 family)